MLVAALAISMSLCVILAPSTTVASPAAASSSSSSSSSHFAGALVDRERRAAENAPQTQSLHMRLADRLLKRVLDLTYETLKDLGASDEDLNAVQHKRNYIQTCYFHAISCY